LRDNAGQPIADRVMLLEDLCALLKENPPPQAALLQLDYKEGQGALDPETVAAFSRTVAPVAANMILSSGEADAVKLLTDATSGLHVGYDPCHGEWIERVQATRDFLGFVATALADSPAAEMIYLHYRLVFFAEDNGFDLIGAFHAAGKRVDAYTINRADAEGLAAAERLVAMKADQITTDDPEGLAAALAIARPASVAGARLA
jgi:glycerophosphoryl diester phosphodiesterase